MTSIQFRSFVDVCDFGAIAAELDQKIMTDGGMSHFTAAETNRDLDAVSILQELQSALDLGIEVIGVDIGRHSDFLDLNDVLILLGFLFLLHLLEAELAVVHDLADGRDGVGSDLNQIQLLFLCHTQSGFSRHDTQLGAVRADDAKLFVPDFFIDLVI